jgi:hypothetical protein
MTRLVGSGILVLLLAANAWAIPKAGKCGGDGPTLKASTLGMQLCLLLQDPWQDCDEHPEQLISAKSVGDTFSDPWQDAEDPWQPFPTVVPGATPDAVVDPWQPLVSQLLPPAHVVIPEDPWQPTFADPLQVR